MIKLAFVPPKPNEFDITFWIFLEIDSFGIKLIEVLVSGISKFNVGGSILVSRDLNENTASTAPAAPKRCPIADLLELIDKPLFDPNNFSTAFSSIISPTRVDVREH